jgi:type VI secretion system VasD/TssJ family lipoprotein
MSRGRWFGVGFRAARLAGLLLACAIAGVFAGCAATNSAMGGNTAKQARAEVSWDYASDALLLEIDAADELNLHQGAPHTLLLTVFQMAEDKAFRKLIADPVALARALESNQPGSDFVLTQRYIVAPGKRTLLSLDRAGQARFVGIVAAYYRLDAASTARLFEVPLVVSSKGWISSTYSAEPGPLAIRLQLGAQGIVEARRLNAYPAAPKQKAWVPLDGGGRQIELDPKSDEGDPAARKL